MKFVLSLKLKYYNFYLLTFFLKGKFYETDPCIPSLRAFKKTGGLHYDPEDVKKYEILILNQLDYKLDYLTSYDIIKFVMNYGVLVEAKFLKDYSVYMKEFIKQYFTLTFFLLEELISEIEIVKFSQLQIACACLMMANLFKFHFIEIDVLLFEYFNLNSEEIFFVFNELKTYLILVFFYLFIVNQKFK